MKKIRIIFLLSVVWGLWSAVCATAFADLKQAEVSFLEGDYDAAVRICDDVIRKGSIADISEAYYLKGRTLLKQNRINQARGVFENILADFSGSHFCDEAQMGLGDTFFAENDFDRAIAEYRKVQEKYPQSRLAALVLYKLGRSCVKSGRMQEGRFYFQKLQQDFPLSFEAKLIDELDDSQFAYSVQVGCFSKYDNAERLTAELKKKGFTAYISEKDGYPVFYRVRVGNFRTKAEANSCKASLQKKGYKTKLCP